MKTDIYIAFYDNRKMCTFIHQKLVRLCTGSNISHVALIFDFGFIKLTPMVLANKSARLLTEDSLNRAGAKCIFKRYMGSTECSIEEVQQITNEHKISSISSVVFWFFISRWFGGTTNHCGTLAVDFLNKHMNFKLKNRNVPVKLMKEIQSYDSNYDCRTS